MTVIATFFILMALGVGAVMWGFKRLGSTSQKVKELEQVLEDIDAKKEIEREVNNLDDDALARELREWVRKPKP